MLDNTSSRMDAQIQRWFIAGRTAHPHLEVPFDVFRARVEASAARCGDSAFEPKCAADLFLVVACEVGREDGWRQMVGAHRTDLIDAALREIRDHEAAESAVDELFSDLALSRNRGNSMLATFEGRGSLGSWLTVCLVRRIWGSGHRRHRTGFELALEDSPAPHDPVLKIAVAEDERPLERAIEAAFERLTVRERLAVQLRFGADLNGAQIARVLGVGTPRVSRLLTSAVARLRQCVGGLLPEGRITRKEGSWSELHDALARVLARNQGGSTPVLDALPS